jgi:hypothetical protein
MDPLAYSQPARLLCSGTGSLLSLQNLFFSRTRCVPTAPVHSPWPLPLRIKALFCLFFTFDKNLQNEDWKLTQGGNHTQSTRVDGTGKQTQIKDFQEQDQIIFQ